jgi:hypothetical protein
MKTRVFSTPLRTIVILMLAVFVVLAGDKKSKDSDSLKAELTDQEEVQLTWNGTDNAAQFAVYRAEVNKVTEDLDYAKLEFTKVETVKEAKFTDKMLTENDKDQPLPALLVYYVAALDKAGKEIDKSSYAEVSLPMQEKSKMIN